MAPRSSSARSLPGIVVPPPAPTPRESAATPRATAISRASGGRRRMRRAYRDTAVLGQFEMSGDNARRGRAPDTRSEVPTWDQHCDPARVLRLYHLLVHRSLGRHVDVGNRD